MKLKHFSHNFTRFQVFRAFWLKLAYHFQYHEVLNFELITLVNHTPLQDQDEFWKSNHYLVALIQKTIQRIKIHFSPYPCSNPLFNEFIITLYNFQMHMASKILISNFQFLLIGAKKLFLEFHLFRRTLYNIIITALTLHNK